MSNKITYQGVVRIEHDKVMHKVSKYTLLN